MAILNCLVEAQSLASLSPEERQFVMERMELAVYYAFNKDSQAIERMQTNISQSFEKLGQSSVLAFHSDPCP